MSKTSKSTITRSARMLVPGAVALAAILGVASPASSEVTQAANDAVDRAISSTGTVTSSDPDGVSNGGVDAVGGSGGTVGDQDHDNGSGNDSDCDDDNKGRNHCAPKVTPPADPDPVVTDPIVTDPIVTEPIVTEPIVTDPIVTDPIVTDPIVTDPIVAPEIDAAPASSTTPVEVSRAAEAVVTMPILFAQQELSGPARTSVMGVVLEDTTNTFSSASLSSPRSAGQAATSGELPRTGGDPLGLSVIGLGLVGLGLAITRSTRSSASTV
ncbi:MAG TPA: hypothetical protein VMZ51_07080 [Acidimicrobiales bacterium]|nr:hypothetical protein [Acidimicrobiales bacterium]